MTHEQMMEKSWNFINELGITENRKKYNSNPANYFLVKDVYQVRNAYYQDLENGIKIIEEDVTRFLERHGIKWE